MTDLAKADRRAAILGATEEMRWYPFSDATPDPRGLPAAELAFRGPMLAVIRARGDGMFLLEIKHKRVLEFAAGGGGCELFVTEGEIRGIFGSIADAKADAESRLTEAAP